MQYCFFKSFRKFESGKFVVSVYITGFGYRLIDYQLGIHIVSSFLNKACKHASNEL